jgi:hypothetical protein
MTSGVQAKRLEIWQLFAISELQVIAMDQKKFRARRSCFQV